MTIDSKKNKDEIYDFLLKNKRIYTCIWERDLGFYLIEIRKKDSDVLI